MYADSIEHTNTARHARPKALRDLQRDWQSWTIGERVAIVMVAGLTCALLYLVHWFGSV